MMNKQFQAEKSPLMRLLLGSLLCLNLLFVLGLRCCNVPLYSDAVLAGDPIAYWSFHDPLDSTTAADASGNGHDGTYSGATPGQPGCISDSAARFDGVDDLVSVPFSQEFNVDNVSIEAVIKWNGSNGFQQRIMERSIEGTVAAYNLTVTDDGHVVMEVFGETNGGASATSTNILQQNTCYHIVGTYEGSSINLYINTMNEADVVASQGNLYEANTGIGIGNQLERNRPFNGVIDELAIYGRTLTQDEIQSHFDAMNCDN